VARRQWTGRSMIRVPILDDGRKFLPTHPHRRWSLPVLIPSRYVAGTRS